MNGRFDVVTVVGVGLLGGSLGLALKARGLAGQVRGVGHRQSSLDTALEVGAVDEVYLDVREATPGSDLVVICTPAALVPDMLDAILPLCTQKTLVTDVASTKAAICDHVVKTWPTPLRFVGSHPMAGSEKYGAEHAKTGLYEGSVTLVTPLPGQDEETLRAITALWENVGCRVVQIDASDHDRMLACTSHIPHLVAACIAELAAGAGDVRSLVGRGFRDVTRVAAGRSELWRDICLTNREAILDGMGTLRESFLQLERAIKQEDGEGLRAFFESAQTARRKALGK